MSGGRHKAVYVALQGLLSCLPACLAGWLQLHSALSLGGRDTPQSQRKKGSAAVMQTSHACLPACPCLPAAAGARRGCELVCAARHQTRVG